MTDEVKRCVEALRFKENFECIECPVPAGNCEENCMLDVAADLIESLSAELEQVKRERDALLEGVRDRCDWCKHFHVGHNGCTYDCDCHNTECEHVDGHWTGWEWCGVKEVSHD